MTRMEEIKELQKQVRIFEWLSFGSDSNFISRKSWRRYLWLKQRRLLYRSRSPSDIIYRTGTISWINVLLIRILTSIQCILTSILSFNAPLACTLVAEAVSQYTIHMGFSRLHSIIGSVSMIGVSSLLLKLNWSSPTAMFFILKVLYVFSSIS